MGATLPKGAGRPIRFSRLDSPYQGVRQHDLTSFSACAFCLACFAVPKKSSRKPFNCRAHFVDVAHRHSNTLPGARQLNASMSRLLAAVVLGEALLGCKRSILREISLRCLFRSAVAQLGRSSPSKYDRVLDLPVGNRPVHFQQCSRLVHANTFEAVTLVEIDSPDRCRPSTNENRP